MPGEHPEPPRPPAPDGCEGPARGLCWLLLAGMMLAALGVRLRTIDFALPNYQEPDSHILQQIQVLRKAELSAEDIEGSSIYPHLLARTAILLFDAPEPLPDAAQRPIEEHLAAAGRAHVQVRTLIAFFSVLLIPATWWIAGFFLDRRWSLVAAALAAVSLIGLQYGQMARPHGAVAPLIAAAVAACLHLRRRGTTAAFALAGLALGLALACLQNAAAVLPALAAAFVLREAPRRRWLEPRVLLTVLCLAAFVVVFYPFAFEGNGGESMAVADGELRLSSQSVELSGFNGKGFWCVVATPWSYEPVTSVLALFGLGVWLVRLVRRRPDRASGAGGGPLDLWVVLAYVLPYTGVIMLYERTQARFVLPLIAFLCCLAAAGARDLTALLSRGRPRAGLTAAVIAAALALPVVATLRFDRLRSGPHTLQQAARWLEQHLDPATGRVGVHAVFDLPLVRREENLVRDGSPRPSLYSPWQKYQARELGPDWKGARWNLSSLYAPGEVKPAQVVRDPWGYFAALDLDHALLPGANGERIPIVAAVRGAVTRAGELRASFPPAGRPPQTVFINGLDTPTYAFNLLTTPVLGPWVEVWSLPRPFPAQPPGD